MRLSLFYKGCGLKSFEACHIRIFYLLLKLIMLLTCTNSEHLEYRSSFVITRYRMFFYNDVTSIVCFISSIIEERKSRINKNKNKNSILSSEIYVVHSTRQASWAFVLDLTKTKFCGLAYPQNNKNWYPMNNTFTIFIPQT